MTALRSFASALIRLASPLGEAADMPESTWRREHASPISHLPSPISHLYMLPRPPAPRFGEVGAMMPSTRFFPRQGGCGDESRRFAEVQLLGRAGRESIVDVGTSG